MKSWDKAAFDRVVSKNAGAKPAGASIGALGPATPKGADPSIPKRRVGSVVLLSHETLPGKLIIPIRIESESNARDHWAKKTKRVKEQRAMMMFDLLVYRGLYGIPKLPLTVTFTRVAPRMLDGHDNLGAGFKGCVDATAAWLGLKSDADDRVEWRYAQRRDAPRTYGVEVVFERRE